jgi:hypothetical protein
MSYVPSKVLIEITHRVLGLRKKGSSMTTKYKLVKSLAFSAAFLTAIAIVPSARAEMGTSGAETLCCMDRQPLAA